MNIDFLFPVLVPIKSGLSRR